MYLSFCGAEAFEELRLTDILNNSLGLAFFYDEDFKDPAEADRLVRFLDNSLSVVVIVQIGLQSEIRERVQSALTYNDMLADKTHKVYWIFCDHTDHDLRQRFSICSVLCGLKHWPGVQYPIECIDAALPKTLYRLTNVDGIIRR